MEGEMKPYLGIVLLLIALALLDYFMRSGEPR